jgi:ketosteroid isomerase-like protein|tara:strand:- start:996 stop:1256 length:261 start_codon:yes stop_codon:yes gene_type:complete
MTKVIYAKYAGKCIVCGNKTERNEEVVWHSGGHGVTHMKCHHFNPRSDNAEFNKGVADVESFREDKALFGTEYAEQLQLEREFNEY